MFKVMKVVWVEMEYNRMECRVLYEVGKHSGVVLNISNECLRKDYFDKNYTFWCCSL